VSPFTVNVQSDTYLPEDARVIHFVNADLIAAGLSPLKPELAAIRAGRLVWREIDRLAAERVDFAFETTLSGLGYVRRMRAWKRAGYASRSSTCGFSPAYIPATVLPPPQ
jgi:predicted ABC-type ATPase